MKSAKQLYGWMLALALLGLVSCGEDLQKKVKELHYEVIGLHDEVMPKICYIELYKAELDSSYADSLEATAPANTYKTLQAELTEAEASMTEWMQKFQPPAAGDDVEKALGYLNKELVRVNGVKSKIETAIKNAQQRIPLSPEKLKACETRQAHSQQP